MKKIINQEKKVEPIKKEVKKDTMREIIIHTDGTNINLVKAEVAGKIELIGLLQNLILHITKEE